MKTREYVLKFRCTDKKQLMILKGHGVHIGDNTRFFVRKLHAYSCRTRLESFFKDTGVIPPYISIYTVPT